MRAPRPPARLATCIINEISLASAPAAVPTIPFPILPLFPPFLLPSISPFRRLLSAMIPTVTRPTSWNFIIFVLTSLRASTRRDVREECERQEGREIRIVSQERVEHDAV